MALSSRAEKQMEAPNKIFAPESLLHLRVVRTSTFRPEIAALRALAVMSVVLFHLRIDGFQGGFVGVDVFFVISG
jgi:hypothetical protein